jgi:hypothetical protein
MMVLLHEGVHFVGDVHVLNGGGHIVFLFIAHLPHDVAQVLTRSGLGETGDDVAGLEAGHWADVLSDQLHALLRNRLGTVSRDVFGLDGDEGDGDFSLDVIMRANDDGLCDLAVLHEYLLHFSGGEAVACSVDDIVLAGHDVEVAILIEEARVASVVVAHQRREVLLHVDVVVVEDGLHEGRRQGLLHVHRPRLVRLALHAGCRVYHLDVVAGQGLAGGPWLFGEGLEAQVVGEDGAAGFGLPVAVIDELALEVVLDPLEGGDVAALPDEGDAPEVGEVVLVDVSALGVLLPDGPDGRGGGVEVLDCIGQGLLLLRPMISQKTSGLGVPTGLPSNSTDLMPVMRGA